MVGERKVIYLVIMFGEKILMPYLLDRKIMKINYIVISHFDTDHCQGLIYIMKELKVENVIIGKQFEECENLNEFRQVVNEKKINVIVVEEGKKIDIEKDIYFDILWPKSVNNIQDNIINNNSLVLKFNFITHNNDFSMLFTGDIEEQAEKELINEYKTNNMLKSSILKVAHHGSKSSSIKQFIEHVNPSIALIGVGQNNLYGHPADQTLKTLVNNGAKIYRTDKDGEISIVVNKKGEFKIQKIIK